MVGAAQMINFPLKLLVLALQVAKLGLKFAEDRQLFDQLVIGVEMCVLFLLDLLGQLDNLTPNPKRVYCRVKRGSDA